MCQAHAANPTETPGPSSSGQFSIIFDNPALRGIRIIRTSMAGASDTRPDSPLRPAGLSADIDPICIVDYSGSTVDLSFGAQRMLAPGSAIDTPQATATSTGTDDEEASTVYVIPVGAGTGPATSATSRPRRQTVTATDSARSSTECHAPQVSKTLFMVVPVRLGARDALLPGALPAITATPR